MLLRKDDPWIEDLPVPDIRDWRVVDADGQTVGFIQSLAVDPKELAVEAILIGANDRYAIDDITVEENEVRVHRRLKRRRTEDRPERADGFRRFDEAYRDHFRRTCGMETTERYSYDVLKPAYGFGREIALDADYLRRPFGRAEEDVRAEYVSRGFVLPYGVARDAVKFGYELAQTLGRFESAGMERERTQMMGTGGRSTDEASRTGSSMDTGAPPDEDTSALGET